VLGEDRREQSEVSPKALRLFEKGFGDLTGGIIDGPNQTKRRSSAIQTIIGENHPLAASSSQPPFSPVGFDDCSLASFAGR